MTGSARTLNRFVWQESDAAHVRGSVNDESRGDFSSSQDTGIVMTNRAASEEDDMLVSSLLARHKAHGHAVSTDSMLTSQQQAGRSDTKQSALLDNNDSDQRHDQQSSKLAHEEPLATASSQINGSLNNVAAQSGVQADIVLQPAAMLTADREDLLIVMPSSIDRMPIVKASRGWRQGVRTYIAFEEEIDFATAPSIFKVRTHLSASMPDSTHHLLSLQYLHASCSIGTCM